MMADELGSLIAKFNSNSCGFRYSGGTELMDGMMNPQSGSLAHELGMLR